MTLTELPVVVFTCAFCQKAVPREVPHTCTGTEFFRRSQVRARAQKKAQEDYDAEVAQSRGIPFPDWSSPEKREYDELCRKMREEAEEGKQRRPCERCGKTLRFASEPVTPGTVLATHGFAHVCEKPVDPATRAATENRAYSEIEALKQRLAELEAGR